MQIYAELSKKLAKKIDAGDADFTMPEGVVLTQRHKGRFCYFECDDDYSRGVLIGLLEDRGVPWQDNNEQVKI